MLNHLEVGGIDRFILNLGWADCGLDNWSVDWGDKEGYRQLRQLRETFRFYMIELLMRAVLGWPLAGCEHFIPAGTNFL